MEYAILSQSVDIETGGGCRIAADNLMVDVILYQQGDWRPQGGVAWCLVDDRFVVMQAMTREEEEEPGA